MLYEIFGDSVEGNSELKESVQDTNIHCHRLDDLKYRCKRARYCPSPKGSMRHVHIAQQNVDTGVLTGGFVHNGMSRKIFL